MKHIFPTAAALAVSMAFNAIVFADPGPRPQRPSNLSVWITGNSDDAIVDLSQGPALLLMGGGGEVTDAFRDRAFPIVNGGDIVVIRTSGSDGYNDYFFNQIYSDGLLKPNSVETMRVDSRAKADSDYVEWVLSTAEMIWIAGGDQSAYTEFWRGTKVEEQLRAAWQRGAVIGGTSAGMAIASEFIYDPGDQSSLTTENAAGNPFHPRLIVSERMIDVPWMDNVITDTHFRNRDRMGRLLGIMAYLRETGRAETIRGVAASEASSIFINRDGLGIVDLRSNGDAVYILDEQETTEREQVLPGQPLKYNNVLRYKLKQDDTYDFASGEASVPAMNLSVDGERPGFYDPLDAYADEIFPPPPPTGNVVYFEDFEPYGDIADLTNNAIGMSVVRIQNGTNTWVRSNSSGFAPAGWGYVATIRWDTSAPKNDWMITPHFELEQGIEYLVSFRYRGGGNNTTDRFDVYMGTERTPQGMVNQGELLKQFTGLTNANTPATAALRFTPESSGMHALAFHANSPADQNYISIDNIEVRANIDPPEPVELIHPADGASAVFPRTWLLAATDPGADSYTIRIATDAFGLDDEASVLELSDSGLWADPGMLAPGQDYFARVDAHNSNGTTEGPVTTFAVLPTPTQQGDLLLAENFDAPWSNPVFDTGYPMLPAGWEALDLDGHISALDAPTAWYVFDDGNARSVPNALVTRYNLNGLPNDDWIFFPTVTTPGNFETNVEFWGRARSGSFPEAVEVRIATGDLAESIDVANYSLVDTINTSSTNYNLFRYTLPPATRIRLALRYASVDQSQFIIDDVRIVLGAPIESSSADTWMIHQ